MTLADDLEDKEADDIPENDTDDRSGHDNVKYVIGFDVDDIPEEPEMIS